MIDAELERRTRQYGREIFARLERQGPLLFTPGWVDDQMMNATMSQEALKVQLFRFIDALPLLKDSGTIAGHLREYLGDRSLPGWTRWLGRRLPSTGFAGRLLARAARANATHLARRFICGSNVHEALQTIRRLRERSNAFTLDLLGEATITEAEADAVKAEYLGLIRGLSAQVNHWPEVPLIDRDERGPIPRVNLSIKLSALYSQFDPIDPEGVSAVVRGRLRPILRDARQHGVFINVDMEQYAFKDTTLRIFREILDEPEFRDWPDVGVALQVYLKETERDLRDLLDWTRRRGTPIWIRLVKGAYWDFETIQAEREGWPIPVFTQKWRSDANFETCARLLMENHEWLRPAFGSHNIRSVAAVLALADKLAVPNARYEFQMLYGMADEIKDALIGMNHRVRVYTPFGQLLPGMAYLVRRLLENTSNESFLRASSKDNVSEERLLMNPREHDMNGAAPPHALSRLPFRNEPLTDFSQQAGRRSMQEAIDEVRRQFGGEYPAIIANQPVQATRWLESRNPSREREIVGRCGRATPADAEQAIQAASSAFPAWRDTSVDARAAYLRTVAGILRRRRFELAAWMILECGKPWREADGDIAEAIDFCEYYADEMLRLARHRRRDLAGEENEYFYEPRGVAVVIAPWNFPLAILCGMTTAALVTGNTVIMKPSEQSSVVAAKFMEVLREAKVPAGVVNYLPGVGEEIGPVLVEHPDVALIVFTGSLRVGLRINRDAANTPEGQHHVKRVIAEMGGKNAVIVDADADLDEAVKGVVESAFNYQGQKCSAGSRVIVVEPLYDQFLHRLIEATKSLAVAPAESPGCSLGPVIDAESRDRILRMIETGKTEAKLVYAADIGPLANDGYFVGPHIFADVPPSASIAQEEIFGPVLAAIRARDLDEALAIANGTRFALTGGFFSRSPGNVERVRREFRVGNLYINRKTTGALVDRQPFGGFKLSGIGSKAGGPDYLLQFLVPRSITENTLRRGFAPTIGT
jgi:RHH-type proline utilization regulon transcriptional repressor/proline dehydrogenase/delta 1-pyrroline-5-carboxylate dehydrogenase